MAAVKSGYRTRRFSAGEGGVFGVRVEGLAELESDLRAVDKRLLTEVRRAFRAAGDPIVDAARRNYARGVPGTLRPQGWRPRTGRSVRGVRTAWSFGAAVIEVGGSRYPHLLGQEWGSKPDTLDSRGRRYGPTRFGPPRGRNVAKPGTFFWPAWVEGQDDLVALVDAAVDDAMRVLAGHGRGAGALGRRLKRAGG